MGGTTGLDILTRHRYLGHLTAAEGVSEREASAFLDVLSASLREGDPEAEAMRAELDARIDAVREFAATVESTGRAEQERERAEAARSVLERVATANDRQPASAIRALAERGLARHNGTARG